MYYRGATLSENTVVVGENVTVTATVENVGDSGGGFTFEFRRNGSEFASPRVTVPSDERRSVTETVSFDRAGTYEITVSDENGDHELAGYVEVQRSALRVANGSDGDRSLTVKARDVGSGQTQTYDVPAAPNQSVALAQWSVRTGATSYDQTLTEYTTPENAAVQLPPADQSTLVGVLAVDSDADIEAATTRFAVDRATLQDAGLSESAVTVYARQGSRWVPLETSVVSSDDERVVYEAAGSGGSAFALGEIRAGVSVADTTIRTAATEGGQRISLDARLQNNGTVDADYEARLVVNGAEVNATTVTVPAGGETTVTLAHEVSEAANYQLALNDYTAGTVVVTSGQVSDDGDTGGEGGSPLDGLAGTLPATVFGIDTLYVGGAVALGLVLVLLLVVVARRGGGNSGGPNSFDDW